MNALAACTVQLWRHVLAPGSRSDTRDCASAETASWNAELRIMLCRSPCKCAKSSARCVLLLCLNIASCWCERVSGTGETQLTC